MIIKDKEITKGGNILISKKTNPYVQINNCVFEDERLSFKAKGILGYLLSKPNNWVVKVNDLYKKSVDGYKSIRSGLTELTLTGYMELKNQFDEESKRYIGRTYVVYEDPLFTSGFRKLENKNKDYVNGEELTDTNPLEVIRFVSKK